MGKNMKARSDIRAKRLVRVKNEAEFFDYIDEKLSREGYVLFETASIVPSKAEKTGKERCNI